MRWQWLPQLWPVALVWAFLVLPSLAWQAPSLLAQDVLPLPWYLRWFLRGLTHVWPYTRVVRMAVAFNSLAPTGATGVWHSTIWQGQSSDGRCPCCGAMLPLRGTRAQLAGLRHLLDHFPGEAYAWADGELRWQFLEVRRIEDWFTPPSGLTPSQADQWMAERAAQRTTGGRPWASTSAGSTSVSPTSTPPQPT